MKTLYRRSEFFTGDSLPLVVQRDVVHDTDIEPHTHEFTELVIVSGGQGIHVTDTGSTPVGRGDVFVMRRGERHGYRSAARLEIVNVLYLRELLTLPADDLQTLPGYHALFAFAESAEPAEHSPVAMHLARGDLSRALTLVDTLDTELRQGAPGCRAMALSLFVQLATFLSRCYADLTVDHRTHNVAIARAVAFLESHASQPLRLEQLASQAGMSRRTFQRLFREMVGSSPIDYLLRTRVTRAARMLAQGYRGSMARLADAVGFGDANYFSRQFKALTGMSPRAYAETARRVQPSQVV